MVLAVIVIGAFVWNWLHDWTDGRRSLAALEAYVAALENRAAEPQQFSASVARRGLLAASSRANAQFKMQAIVRMLAAETGVRLISVSPATGSALNEPRIVLDIKLMSQPEMLTHFLVRLRGTRPLFVLDRIRIDAPEGDSKGILKISAQLHGFYRDKP
jgi:hypothetical protein